MDIVSRSQPVLTVRAAIGKAQPSAPPRNWEAVNRYGEVKRTFSHKDQAEDYRDRMAALGSEITVRLAWVQHRVAA